MPDLAPFHPQLVHFVVALSVVGVAARVLSLVPTGGRVTFLGPMAATLLLIAAVASYPAAKSGFAAHGPAERVPGAREAVQEHEEAGESAHQWLFVLGAVELAALALLRWPKAAAAARVLAAAVGLFAVTRVYAAGEAGGKLVYSYAGGVGLRSGDPADLGHLMNAALYHNAMQARDAGAKEDAARWVAELAREHPEDADVKFLSVESRLEDLGDARGALLAADALEGPKDNVRFELRRASIAARAYAALGQVDSGRVRLETVRAAHPGDERVQAMVKRALDRLEGGAR